MVAVLAARIKLGWQVEQTSLQNTDQLHVMVPTKFWAWHLHHKILCPTPSLAATPLNGQLPWQVPSSTRKIPTSEILILFSDWNGNVDNSSAGYERKHTDMDGAHEMRRVREFARSWDMVIGNTCFKKAIKSSDRQEEQGSWSIIRPCEKNKHVNDVKFIHGEKIAKQHHNNLDDLSMRPGI